METKRRPLQWISYRELDYLEPHDKPATEAEARRTASELLSLRDNISAEPQEHEEEIARYLEQAPGYSGMGKVVGDMLDPSVEVILFPGRNTDGCFVWPAELAYYVRRYHLRVPRHFVAHMASLNWWPPAEEEIDWDCIYSE
jgi:hypothetical protein